MRLLLAILASVAAFGLPAVAQPFQTPQELIAAFYAPYLADEIPENEAAFRSDALNALYEEDAESTEEGDIGAIEFDPYVDGQDFMIADFSIGDPIIEGDQAQVVVSFTNFGEPRDIIYDLVRENGSWLIDDVANEDAEHPYRLSQIFAEARADR
ncbi:Protein of unknown function [Devosia crocina]|uniref:DUF3828 domain-containing protein n=1 Tax=Devosia crocina TaxID=429728 RepID=A0A1I7N746_9HYPH|nr:DUF3828 domain-containing protein [Devosia crocina]SFV30467.1 Protein of unknown function [Devosia crocina]